MSVDDARQDDLSMQIDDASLRSDQCADRLIRAHRDKGIPAHRERLGDAAAGILGVNSTVEEGEIGGRLSHGGDGGQQRGHCSHQPPGEPCKTVRRRPNR